jgi:hypothetical protein
VFSFSSQTAQLSLVCLLLQFILLLLQRLLSFAIIQSLCILLYLFKHLPIFSYTDLLINSISITRSLAFFARIIFLQPSLLCLDNIVNSTVQSYILLASSFFEAIGNILPEYLLGAMALQIAGLDSKLEYI